MNNYWMVGLLQNVLCRSENQDGCHYRVNLAWGQMGKTFCNY